MKKSNLAEELRKRQIQKELHTREELNIISDDFMISAYCFCSSCGEYFVNPEHIERIILECVSVEDFLNMTTPKSKCCK